MVKQKSLKKGKRVPSRAKARSRIQKGSSRASSCKASCKATCRGSSRKRSKKASKRRSRRSSHKRKSKQRSKRSNLRFNLCGGALEDIIIPTEEIPIEKEVPTVVEDVIAPRVMEKVQKAKRGRKAKSYICTQNIPGENN